MRYSKKHINASFFCSIIIPKIKKLYNINRKKKERNEKIENFKTNAVCPKCRKELVTSEVEGCVVFTCPECSKNYTLGEVKSDKDLLIYIPRDDKFNNELFEKEIYNLYYDSFYSKYDTLKEVEKTKDTYILRFGGYLTLRSFNQLSKIWEHRNELESMEEYDIPVLWQVFDRIPIRGLSLEDAVRTAKENFDLLPLGTNPAYVEDSYQIDDGNDGNNSVEETVKYLEDIYYY